MAVEIRPLHPLVAGEVAGVDCRRPLDRDTVAAIAAGMDRHAVLVFRDQDIADAEQLAFTRHLRRARALWDAGAHPAAGGTAARFPGASWFFTVNPADRRLALLTEPIGPLRAAVRAVRARHPFAIDAAVVLPDHLHMIWTLPEEDADFATRWRLIKAGFAHALPAGEPVSPSRAAKGERGIWQRRYWEHTLREEADFLRHLDYIHFNPVKHGHATRVRDWPYSSFHRWVRLACYPEDWAGDAADPPRPLGER